MRVGIVDVESTGLDYRTDHIIEVAYGIHENDWDNPWQKVREYESFQDPGFPLSAEITEITGITDGMLHGQQADWNRVRGDLRSCDFVIAANAAFDRGFIEERVGPIPNIVSDITMKVVSNGEHEVAPHPRGSWACSILHIDWRKQRMYSKALRALCWEHRLTPRTSHRAMADVQDLSDLLFTRGPDDNLLMRTAADPTERYIDELLRNAKRPGSILWIQTRFDEASNAILRGNGFRWSPKKKVWYMVQFSDETNGRLKLLSDAGINNVVRTETIEPVDPTDPRLLEENGFA